MPSSQNAPIFPGGLAGRFETRDFEEMATLPAKWNQVCRQVEPGAFEVWMNIVHTDRVQLGEVHSGRGMAVDGLRTGHRLNHVIIMDVPTYHKAFMITDAGINIAPNLEEKADILQSAIGVAQPKIGILSAV